MQLPWPLLSRNFSGIGRLALTGVKSCSSLHREALINARHHRAGVKAADTLLCECDPLRATRVFDDILAFDRPL